MLQLVDIRVGPTEDDVMMMNFLLDHEIPFVVVFTKTDKLSKTALAEAIARLRTDYFDECGIETIAFSAVTREGKDLLLTKIAEAAGYNG